MDLGKNGKTALVVAHPDDEILWFSSIVDKVDRVLICFLEVPTRPDWSAGRQQAARQFPLANADFLEVTESEVFNGADWSAPVETGYGLEVKHRDNVFPGFNGARYRANYDRLCQELSRRLQGYTRVFTHNPWGEYGHEEHVQVYRAVSNVKSTLGFDVYFSNYCSSRSYQLMLRHISGFTSDYQTVETNPGLAKQIEQLYRASGCWTWPFDDYAWFTHECFMKDSIRSIDPARAGHAFSLNFIKIGALQDGQAHASVNRIARVLARGFKAVRAAWD